MDETESKPRTRKGSALHAGFELGILLKGIHAALEIIGGVLLVFVKPAILSGWVRALTQNELVEDPQDFLANLVVRASGHYSLGSQHFGIVYLLSHGLVKIILVLLLWRRKLWAYPLAAGVLVLFIGYQVMRWTHTHSGFLMFLSVFDAVMIWLTLVEYRRLTTTTAGT